MHRTASLLLAALLGLSVQAQAFDSSDPFGVNTPAEKPAKAPREKNDGRWLENQVTGFAAGAAAGAAANVSLGGAAAALNPVVALPVIFFVTDRVVTSKNAKTNAFYSGTVVRGRVLNVEHEPSRRDLGGWYDWIKGGIRIFPKHYGFDLISFPPDDVLSQRFDVLHLDVDGPEGTASFAVVQKGLGYQVGDVVDVQSPVGVFALNMHFSDRLHFDFNKHMPRVVNVYCKHDNPACQNDYDSSLGVIARPNLTEFPPSQYLIDPAIIAADQAKMRKEEEEKKAAGNSGGFSFL